MDTTTRHDTREAWLAEGVEKITAALFRRAGYEVPKVRVSVGFPKGRGGKAIGQCWSPDASEDRIAQVFIHPELDEPTRVLDVLAHELIHAAIGTDKGHGAAFRQAAHAIGLEGKMTATVAGTELRDTLATVASELGTYPHGKLNTSNAKKQTTRLLKAECVDCGCIVRITRKWLDEVGAPTCGCGGLMVEG